MAFKQEFVWGAATASYQVEGAAYEDGKGLNIWDIFCKEEGRIYEGQNGDAACDQYHLYKDDVKLMKELGIQAYRFSISWARIMPDGTGRTNQKGIDYYNHLIDELIANGIEPFITLYHWDLPYKLHERGGWLNPESPEWFYQYARVVAENFSDRTANYFTLNEPQCTVGLGYYTGEHAPGLKVGKKDFFSIFHNILKAHGRAVQALRAYAKQPVKIGMAPCGALYYPSTNSPEDIEAARRMNFHIQNPDVNECIWNIAFVCDPIYKGTYPKEVFTFFGDELPEITKEDMQLISQPLDFHGQNIYNAVEIRADANGNPKRVKRFDGFPKTAIQWPVTPECLYWAPKYLYERYQKPIYITENGMSSHDWPGLDGKIHDGARIDFMHRYLLELKKAADSRVDIAGYFVWSLLDNFEWAKGYSDRFGIVYVDYQTKERIPKDSAYFYRDIIKHNSW
ncbi:MAG: beta-glucosidase [Eubacterium sp.]|nr:beta-glucosidase [Eubacterium sp.]